MSTMQSPPPDSPVPAGPPERRCPRCGSTMAADQEWCLACGAAAGTEVVESTGWRVPLYLGGGLVALAIIGVIVAIVALSDQKQETPTGTPTPQGTAAVPTVSPLPTSSAIPTVSPAPTISPVPTETATAEPTDTPTAEPTTEGSGTFSGWTGADGDYTIIIASEDTENEANDVAQSAQDKGMTVGVLNSDDYSNLNGGYWVVFTGTYTSESDAEADLDGVQSDYKDAYVRQIKQ
jgi:hypothetical protein